MKVLLTLGLTNPEVISNTLPSRWSVCACAVYDPCSVLGCLNSGTCIVLSYTEARCACLPKYTGTRCEFGKHSYMAVARRHCGTIAPKIPRLTGHLPPATRRVSGLLVRRKCKFFGDSTPDPAGGAYSAPPDGLAGGEAACFSLPSTPPPLLAFAGFALEFRPIVPQDKFLTIRLCMIDALLQQPDNDLFLPRDVILASTVFD